MKGRFQAGRPLTNYHATSKHTVACQRCQRQLDVRVSAKGYPGQERDDVWLDCPACGEMGVTVVGMPDTGGADIRVTPIWRRLLSGGDGAETYPLLMLLGGLMVGFPAVRWMHHRSWDGAVRMARDMCVMGCVAVVCWIALTRGPVREWSRSVPGREQVVWTAGLTLAAALALAVSVLLPG